MISEQNSATSFGVGHISQIVMMAAAMTNGRTDEVATIEAGIMSDSIVIRNMETHYPNGFRGTTLFRAVKGVSGYEEGKYPVATHAGARVLMIAGYFQVIGLALRMVNSEQTKPRRDREAILDTKEELMGIVVKWRTVLNGCNKEDPILKDYFRTIEKGEIASGDEESDEGGDEIQVKAGRVMREIEWGERYANRRAAAAEYVEAMRWFAQHYPAAHAEFCNHMKKLVAGTDWRYPQVAEIDDLLL